MTIRNLIMLVTCALSTSNVTAQTPSVSKAPGASGTAASANAQQANGQQADAKDDGREGGDFGWISIETIELLLDDEPQSSMDDCRREFAQKDFADAAEELGDVAAYMSDAAKNATGDAKSKLQASADELEELAANVKSGSVTSVKPLTDAFARAQIALAGNWQQQAKNAFAGSNFSEIGDFLSNAISSLEHAGDWNGQDLGSTTTNTINNVKQLVGKLSQGGQIAPAEFNQAMSDIGSAIEGFGRSTQSSNSPLSNAQPSNAQPSIAQPADAHPSNAQPSDIQPSEAHPIETYFDEAHPDSY